MSNGGVFQIITNDGKQDRMLNATALLNRRLALIEDARSRDPTVADPTPTLLDIEKTHILFMNASFKPFAAVGYEYQKLSATGTVQLGSTGVTFSLPTYGDFIGDMCLHATLAAPTITASSTFETTATTVAANTATVGAQHSAAFAWCSFPGERLLQNVAFTVSGNPLDSYTPASVNMYREFLLKNDDKKGWFRGVGQELPTDAFLRQPGTNPVTTAGSDGAVNTSTTGSLQGGSVNPSHRIGAAVLNGNQTPKSTAAAVDLWIPLLFWFNMDPRLAVPSVALPHANRYITVDLAASSKMYGLVPRGVGTWADPKATLTDATQTVTTFELYVNNIFVNPEVHDIFIKRIGFSLIRVHREHIESGLQSASGSVLLSKLKWPIEAMFVGMRVSSYEGSRPDNDKWHSFSQVTPTAYSGSQMLSTQGTTKLAGATVAIDAAGVVTVGAGGAANTELAVGDVVNINGYIATVLGITSATSFSVTPVPNFAIASKGATTDIFHRLANPQYIANVRTRTVDSLTVTAHGVPLYNNFNSKFFSDYLPLRYSNIVVGDEVGAMMINFCFYPGSYQPSGHINVSRAREFYFAYVSSVCSTSIPCSLVVVASAINFLLISDGSAVLRYTT
jgi:hypothetical protein